METDSYGQYNYDVADGSGAILRVLGTFTFSCLSTASCDEWRHTTACALPRAVMRMRRETIGAIMPVIVPTLGGIYTSLFVTLA